MHTPGHHSSSGLTLVPPTRQGTVTTCPPEDSDPIHDELRSMTDEINQLKNIILPGRRGNTFLPTDIETKSQWMTVAEFAISVGLTTKIIQQRIRDNQFSKKSIKNVGTAAVPIYRMHAHSALKDFYKNK